MLIAIKLFAEDQSDSPELDSPMSSSAELQSCRAIMVAHLINSDSVALGVLRKSVEHAFCATLYASCLFFPVHLGSEEGRVCNIVVFCMGTRLSCRPSKTPWCMPHDCLRRSAAAVTCDHRGKPWILLSGSVGLHPVGTRKKRSCTLLHARSQKKLQRMCC